MKTTTYFTLLTFLIFLGCSKNDEDLNATLKESQIKPASETQLNNESTERKDPKGLNYTVSHNFKWGYWTPLICDEVVVGSLEGILDVHCVMFGHYNPDFPGNLNKFVWQWMIMNYSGFLTNESTGEVFKIIETDKVFFDGTFTWHSNIIGDKGSHYILFGSSTDAYPWFKIDKAICLGS